jgi:hypothetical protein
MSDEKKESRPEYRGREELMRYNKILKSLDSEVPLSELEEISMRLCESHPLLIYGELKGILGIKGKNLGGSQRTRIDGIIKEYLSQTDLIKSFLKNKLPKKWSIRLFNPRKQNHLDLKKTIATVGTCIDEDERYYDEKEKEESRKIGKWLRNDSLIGGTIISFNYSGKRPKIYNKFFIVRGKDNKDFLFYDTIEEGDTGLSNVDGWEEKGHRKLFYNFSSSLWLAKKLGFEKVAMGDRELEELAERLGFKEEYPFSKDVLPHSRKLGFRGDDSGKKGPYIYQLGSQSHFRVIPLDILSHRVEILSRFDEIYEFSKRKNNQQKEIGLYFDVFEALTKKQNHDTYVKARQIRKTMKDIVQANRLLGEELEEENLERKSGFC